MLEFPKRTPSDNLDYTFNFRAFIRKTPGDYLTSANVLITSGPTPYPTISNLGLDTESVTVWISGGVVGIHTLTCEIHTHDGRVAFRSVKIETKAQV